MKHKNMLKQKEIQNVIKQGTLLRFLPFVCYSLKTDQQTTKIGIAVSKKIKPIVKKNKVKRQLKVIIAPEIDSLLGFHLVFIAGSAYFNYDFVQIKNFIKKILNQITSSLKTKR